ncbi:MAG: DUF1659 domain-containing protein [Clostridiales bacterium]|nr:DUF1659 domain-containing protein [Clostridiales bacterium]MDY2728820.1 DUF1659 domain-containing protein [Clostridium sp.]
MTQKYLQSVTLAFKIQTGYNNIGEAIIQKKSFTNIYPNATEEDLIAISNAFKNVLQGSIIGTEIVESYTLSDN